MKTGELDKVVILARGLGTRMRQKDGNIDLNKRQRRVANTGIKALIPIAGRPFLDYILNTLADAGYRRICLVIGPEHHPLRTHYNQTLAKRLHIEYAIQRDPLGTADAVVAAESFVGDDPFLVINSDTYYPLNVLKELKCLQMPGLAVFNQMDLLVHSNIPAERLSRFAIVELNALGYLEKIIEKPDIEILDTRSVPVQISMNCWRFDPMIFSACRSINFSPRGELELPYAVQYAINELDQRFQVVSAKGLVLDLTHRTDIESVRKQLANMQVHL